MFVLNPGGKGSGGMGGSQGTFSQHLWFFGQFGLYFGALRLAFVYMSSGSEGGSKQIQQ